ncbi:hypothetical protein ASPZODRAFT_1316459 [Penicilliopsis zonata CBS 506.65]|uniref:Wings apart-like protein C-terminal domain-containing protein n=1 Tax=Penicilliopsis zonata CBS 506.65 TaxID=1073090 RepID=A0A1L9SNK2_9EURO|nr:hypothetical protein ASPZODRAFT_1316459 [Penicilliopsis zonata CBS 506.65]OJJ48768.1 hypothetical protein ASPZODRAFT_1316459 [Penicilliopsis zonata CBS 506.65]
MSPRLRTSKITKIQQSKTLDEGARPRHTGIASSQKKHDTISQPSSLLNHRDSNNASQTNPRKASVSSQKPNVQKRQQILLRRRLVDSLDTQENNSKERLFDQTAKEKLSLLSGLTGTTISRNQVGEPESMKISQNQTGSRGITYARERSFLSTIKTTSKNDHSMEFGCHPSSDPHTSPSSPVSTSLVDQSSNGRGPVQSIHELRQAGVDARLRGTFESVFEDIEHAEKSNTIRRSGFILLCQKLQDEKYIHGFINGGFEHRLLLSLDRELDIVSAILGLCCYELIQSRSHSALIPSISSWPKILNLTFVLLGAGDDISRSVTDSCLGLSRGLKRELQDVISRMRPVFGEQFLFMSPRLAALWSLRSTLKALHSTKAKIPSMDPPFLHALTILLNLLAGEASQETPHLLDLLFQIFEIYVAIPGSLTEDLQSAVELLPTFYNLLDPSENENSRSKQCQVSYIRLILNVTNNSPSFSKHFATLEIVGGLVRLVQVELGSLKDQSVIEKDSYDTVILALGALINMSEGSEASRHLLMKASLFPSPISQLVQLFQTSIKSFTGADSVPEIQYKVAIGYLSVLLATLCLDSDLRIQVEKYLNGNDLAGLLSTVDEFLHYHQTVEKNSHSVDPAYDSMAGFTARLQHVVAQLREPGA